MGAWLEGGLVVVAVAMQWRVRLEVGQFDRGEW